MNTIIPGILYIKTTIINMSMMPSNEILYLKSCGYPIGLLLLIDKRLNSGSDLFRGNELKERQNKGTHFNYCFHIHSSIKNTHELFIYTILMQKL